MYSYLNKWHQILYKICQQATKMKQKQLQHIHTQTLTHIHTNVGKQAKIPGIILVKHGMLKHLYRSQL